MSTSTTAEAPGPDRSASTSGGASRHRVLIAATVVVLLLVAVAAVVVSRGGAPAGIDLADLRAGQSSGDAAAVYLRLTAVGGDDALIGATASVGRRVSLHLAERQGGLTTMRVTDRIELPDGTAVRLEPGGSHLMLEGLGAPLRAGERFELTLKFARSGSRTAQVEVVRLADLLEAS